MRGARVEPGHFRAVTKLAYFCDFCIVQAHERGLRRWCLFREPACLTGSIAGSRQTCRNGDPDGVRISRGSAESARGRTHTRGLSLAAEARADAGTCRARPPPDRPLFVLIQRVHKHILCETS
ncbi:hypothetical protein EVAR_102143_1 [Eumeta japonica]|uniref:Uncharacterized protein n=1 Tax=Eumeta variegata TaxID=151549 RepID=A0A4C1TZU8_EUMVA|nr:hypothetical protein EVAR_102143_1 [Eumeta japonica]